MTAQKHDYDLVLWDNAKNKPYFQKKIYEYEIYRPTIFQGVKPGFCVVSKPGYSLKTGTFSVIFGFFLPLLIFKVISIYF